MSKPSFRPLSPPRSASPLRFAKNLGGIFGSIDSWMSLATFSSPSMRPLSAFTIFSSSICRASDCCIVLNEWYSRCISSSEWISGSVACRLPCATSSAAWVNVVSGAISRWMVRRRMMVISTSVRIDSSVSPIDILLIPMA